MDTTQIKWIYPPEWAGEYPSDTGYRRMKVRLTGDSDGTGETDAIKVNKSELLRPDGSVPGRLIVEAISWNVHSMTAKLEWDNSTDEVIKLMNAGVPAGSNSGEDNWLTVGGLAPQDTDGSGDIVLTTSNVTEGSTYDITLSIRLAP